MNPLATPPAALPATKAQLFAHFDALGLSYKTLDHRPIFTVEEGADIKAVLPGGHTKNLFLRDKHGAFFLVCALGSSVVALNQLHKTLGCARLSFGNEAMMHEMLGVTPGSVTVFGLINDTARRVTLVLDEALLAHELVNFHPLSNSATTAISSRDLIKFVTHWGGQAFSCDFCGDIPIGRHLTLAI